MASACILVLRATRAPCLDKATLLLFLTYWTMRRAALLRVNAVQDLPNPERIVMSLPQLPAQTSKEWTPAQTQIY